MLSSAFCRKRMRCIPCVVFLVTFVLVTGPVASQVNTGGTATTANHQKQVIGYLSNWDAWKSTAAGVPAQGALNHLNIDYGKYTILNYSFFGVASDGSLHSGDLRNKDIYQPGATQPPGDIFYVDPYSSWDLHLLFGELELVQHLSADAVSRATAQGFQVVENGTTWSHPTWGLYNKPLPVPLHKSGGAPGVLKLAKEKGVKVLASIGGWSMSKHFPEMAADPAKRQRFINDCVKLINTGFDGIDLDWEFVGPFAGMNFTGSAADFANFTNLVQQIRNAVGPTKLITAALPADPAKLQGFEWSKLNSLMNYYNIMTYDFNGGWSNKAGHNAPLYSYPGAEAPNFNWNSSYNALVSYGVPKSMVNMGSPFYGRGVITTSAAALNGATQKRSETVQPDGPITTCADFTNWPRDVYDGTPNYFYIKQVALSAGSGWIRSWDNDAKVPYLTKSNYFLSYDDEESIAHKAQYIVDNQLAGTIIWTVFGDLEMSGTPTQFGTKLIRYPTVKSTLVNKINEVFAKGSSGLPVVAITSPANGATVATGSNVVIAATASDPGGSIAKVEFLHNGAKVGEDLTSPYSFTITSIPAGNHTLTARAIDNASNTASHSVSITASSNTPPSVAITAPSNGATFTAPASITISVTASDNGTVTKVEFYQGSLKLGEDTSSPYSFAWTNVAAGSYTLTAKATDDAGLSSTSSAISITVNPSGGGSCSGVPQYVNGTAYATGAEVQNVNKKFKCAVGGWCSQGGAYEPGVGWAWTDAWTLLGDCTGGNANPTASITSPANNASFAAPASITINATASDTDGTIAKVEFFNGSALLGTDMSAPYSFSWSNVGAGNYSLTAKATDNAGGTGTSAVISVTVTGNTAPTASITAPANNAAFTAPATITISASASDAGGSVTKVEFFQGATKLGEDLSSPYSWSWANVAAGSYSLTAKATDNTGLTGTSSPVNITVTTSGGCNDPQYVENGGYVAGSRVKNAGNSYECKPHPYTGWCNGAAWAYAPGTGTYWQDAWILKGPCTSARLQTHATPDPIVPESQESIFDDDGFSTFPVPGRVGLRNAVTLRFAQAPGEIVFELTDVNGGKLLNRELGNVQKEITVEFPALSTGLYLIHVRSAKRTWLKKYVIQ